MAASLPPSSSPLSPPSPSGDSIRDHAKYYVARLGAGLCRIRPHSKDPGIARKWNANPIDSERKIDTIRPGEGIGILHSASLTCALDIDHLEYARAMFATFGIDLDAVLGKGLQISSGRPNRGKALFRIPPSMTGRSMYKVCWPKPNGGKINYEKARQLRPDDKVTVVEFRQGPVQDVLPPSIHPDTGEPYRFVRSPWELETELGEPLPMLPPELLPFFDEPDAFRPQLEAACPWLETPVPESRKRKPVPHGRSVIDAFNEAHDIETMLKRHGYIERGKRWLYPGSSTKVPGAVVFEEVNSFYSHHASDPLGDGYKHDPFDLFVHYDHNGDVRAAVRAAARLLSIPPSSPVTPPEPDPARPVRVEPDAVTPEIRPIPGVLQEVSDWVLRTAARPVPIFAAVTAITFGSVIAARKYQARYRNSRKVQMTPLYAMAVGPTACGKEHIKSSLEELLEAADMEDLIGPGKFASEAAVIGTLIDQPACVAILDEFGKSLSGSQGPRSLLASDTFKILMEVFGRCAGTLRQIGYSSHGLSKAQKEEMSRRFVRNPCLSVVALTTPDTLFANITSAEVADGLLNRFLIVHTDNERSVSRDVDEDTEIPDRVLDWAHRIRCQGIDDQDPVVSAVNDAHDMLPNLATLPYTNEAWQLTKEFERHCVEQANLLDKENLGDLYVRTREIAMRVSLIVALSCEARQVEVQHVEWANHFVSEITKSNIHHFRMNLADSEFDRIRQSVLSQVIKGGKKGRTHREVVNFCRQYRSVPPQIQDQVIVSLERDGLIESRQIRLASGQARVAWVALEQKGVDTVDVECLHPNPMKNIENH